jgi:hypothetical protein
MVNENPRGGYDLRMGDFAMANPSYSAESIVQAFWPRSDIVNLHQNINEIKELRSTPSRLKEYLDRSNAKGSLSNGKGKIWSKYNYVYKPPGVPPVFPPVIPPIEPPVVIPPETETPPIEIPRGAVAIDNIVFAIGDRDPAPTFSWSIEHRILEIPINGFYDITIGLSGDGEPGGKSGSRWHLTVTARSITEVRFRQLWQLAKRKGPYMIQCPEENMMMYLKSAKPSRKLGDLAPPFPIGSLPGQADFVADWTLEFIEEND